MSNRKRIKPRFWLVMMCLLLVAFGVIHITESRYLAYQQEEIARLLVQRNRIATENAAIERKIAFSKTDEYIERTARTELGLLKPGEIRFVAGTNVAP